MIDNIKTKLESLSVKQQIIALILLLLIFFTLFVVATKDKVQVIEYKNRNGEVLCTETYINGELNGTACDNNLMVPIDSKLFGDTSG